MPSGQAGKVLGGTVMDFDSEEFYVDTAEEIIGLGSTYANHFAGALKDKGRWGHYYDGPRLLSSWGRPAKLSTGVYWHQLENGGFLSPLGVKVAEIIVDLQCQSKQ